MPDFLLPVQYLRQIAEQLRVMGVAPAEWLGHCGVGLEQLDDPHYQPRVELFGELIQQALRLSEQPALGLLIGERLGVGTHGALGFAALQGGSLRQVVELLERYLAVRITLVRVQLEQDEAAQQEHLRFVPTHPLGAIEHTVIEAVMLAVKNIFDAITPGGGAISRISLPFPEPAYAELASQMYGCTVCYAQPRAAFTLTTALLDTPLRMADPAAFREAELICQRELRKLGETSSLGGRVRRLILERQNAFPSLVVTARLLCMTPRTLHRRLLAEGTSYKQVLKEVRHALALEHIRAGRLSVEEIAQVLGYSDVANFRRAFRQWEGVAPSEYLRAQGELPGAASRAT
ncbi:AraC family transcriptional regulator [Pseudomonas sp. USHLN015]|uniref:AraC family transcriptional regulator n=1 Tax=Pseudomonas sp. USHLN015 TaxID=3081296 RepID=UPI00301C012B